MEKDYPNASDEGRETQDGPRRDDTNRTNADPLSKFAKDKRKRITRVEKNPGKFEPTEGDAGTRYQRDDRPRQYNSDERGSRSSGDNERRSYNPNFTQDNKLRGGNPSYRKDSGSYIDTSKDDYFNSDRYNPDSRDRRPAQGRDNRGERTGGYGQKPSYGNRTSGYGNDNRGGYNKDNRQGPDRNRSYGGDRSGGAGRPSGSGYGQGNRGPSGDNRPSGYGSDNRGGYNKDNRPGGYGDRGTSRPVGGNYGQGSRNYGEGRPSGQGGRTSNYGEGRPSGQGGRPVRYGDNRQGGPDSRYGNRNQQGGFSPRAGGQNRGGFDPRRSKPAFDKENYPKYPRGKQEEEIRLNRYLSMSGICSRREADDLIAAGQVTVNGTVVTEMGSKVLPDDVVRYEGTIVQGESKVYIVMNKPKGYVTSLDDPHAEKTVMEILNNSVKERVYPVGRLDKNSMGVLLITNDGDMTKKLTHPSYEKKKIYQVTLDKPLTREDMRSIAEGVTLEDGFIRADSIDYVKEGQQDIGIEIHSGRNRIVRRIFEHLGYQVRKLDRVYFAGLTKKNLKRGQWRFLTPREVSALHSGQYE